MALGDKLRALFARRRRQPRTVISMHRERQVAVFSILLLLLVGLPLWWTTTRVYRADLPSEKVNLFAPENAFEVPLIFYIDTESPLSADKAQLIQTNTQALIDAERASFAVGEWRVRYLVDVRVGAAPDAPGHYTLYLRADDATTTASISVGSDRSATISVTQSIVAEDILPELISSIVINEEQAVRGKDTKARKKSQSSHAAVNYAPEYSITLTLLNEDPVNGAVVDWEIEQAVDAYLKPFVDKISPLTKLSLSSQILHHAGSPPVVPLRANNQSYLTPEMLPHFVNSPSWNFASIDPISPMLNFLLFVPELTSQPMHIADEKGDIQSSEAFLVSQWGGVAIANLPDTTRPGDRVKLSKTDMQKYMGYYIAQLRQLIGIRSGTPLPQHGSRARKGSISRIDTRLATETGISDWEFDALLRQWLIRNRQTAITTLQSLVRLVNSLQNMVVMDEIKAQVDKSLEALYKAEQALTDILSLDSSRFHHSYQHAFESAAAATAFAETAFFDPSMVSMLYFPDQHKYAIYMPFFLPVAIPVLAAIKRIISERRRNKAIAAGVDSADHAAKKSN
ncbi:GPI transamidase component [Coemansia guatemalensis]|uniref:GPI transamidase component n=1 Tax=Coemansia guatemalensis TaxID=2761395 RepID=A0A9W8LT66_9FUNG|nr:GPI transamidase component [Coemansia guatemalensis]